MFEIRVKVGNYGVGANGVSGRKLLKTYCENFLKHDPCIVEDALFFPSRH